MEIKDKIVVITGGSKGLGKVLAYAFRQAGSTVIISARKMAELEKAAAEIGAIPMVADVTKEPDLLSLATKVVESYGRIDIWINNAGIWMPPAPIETTNWKRAHDLIEVNLFGTVYGSKAALIPMRKQNAGVIVNILSTSALDGRSGSSAYGASKYAALGFTKSLRKEVADDKISVIAVYPGGMQTNLFDEKKPEDIGNYMPPYYVAEKIIANIERTVPEEELIIRRSA